jgi:hypothetical protein
MKNTLPAGISVAATAACVVGCLTLIAWTGPPVFRMEDTNYVYDTVPVPGTVKGSGAGKELTKERDLDKELRKLDEVKSRLQQLSANDWQNIADVVEAELAKVDLAVSSVNMEKVLNDLDVEKINERALDVLREVNLEDMLTNMKKSQGTIKAAVDTDEIRKALAVARVEVEKELAAIKEINIAEVKTALADAQVEISKLRVELKERPLQINDELRRASEDLEAAKSEIKGYQSLIYALEKEGLLDTSSDYSIEYREGTLNVNGKKQPASVTEKYRQYFPKGAVNIRKEKGQLNINGNRTRSQDHDARNDR